MFEALGAIVPGCRMSEFEVVVKRESRSSARIQENFGGDSGSEFVREARCLRD